MKALLALLLVATSTLMAGCSGSGAQGTVPDQDAEGRYVIEMTSANKFVPATARVPAGATVVWVHAGGAPHDVEAKDGSFSSGPAGGLRLGDEWEHTFDEPGTYPYVCRVHESAGMRGTLIVEAAE